MNKCPLVPALPSSTHHRLQMDPTDTNSQEHEGDFINITQLSNPAGDENVDHPSADEVTNQTDVSPPQYFLDSKILLKCVVGTDTTQETSRKDDGSETENDVGKEKHLEKDHEGSWSNVEDKKGHEDVLKEIKMPKTHDLYCSKCTHNITGTAKLFKKGQETFPYNIDRFVFVIIFSFKYPFIYIPWLYNITQGMHLYTHIQLKPSNLILSIDLKPDKTNQLLTPEEPVKRLKTDQPIPPVSPKEPVKLNQPNPLPPKVPSDPKRDNTLATLLVNIREKLLPNRLPRLSPTSQRFLLVLVLLLLSVILLLTLPSRPSGPSPPSPPPQRPSKHGNSKETDVQLGPGENVPENGEGGDVSFSWLTNFLSSNYLSIILLLFLAILAVLWRSMIGDSFIFHLLFCHLTFLNIYQSHQYICCRGHPYKALTTKARHPEEYCIRRSNRVHHKLWCCILRCCFRNFHSITDKGRYQEAAIFVAASLVCVISLSFAKAYAFGMDKLKTVAAYTGIAIAGSALSFVASQHARDVFAKYDFHKLASDYLKG
ncbi:uncharacterized protein LOC125579841 [Brassica napus]|uniref:uncharacterized protein LOC125579841 n=1 Tax=Brassica napus TaxID=3708 RepID=UPI0020787AA1|nr:uncharacterized protein LOC125579841 [Brassica napus]